jgi:MFS family permease
MLQAVSVTTMGVLPAFLLGALAVQVGDELDIGPAEIGVAAAMLFAVAGLLARPLGLLVQHAGAERSMMLSATFAAISLAGASAARSIVVLAAALMVGGAANAMAQPAANLSISRAIGSQRLGLAFGIKQSSIPAASLIAGLTVPGIALVVGWRWAFLTGALAAVGVAAWAIRRSPESRAQPSKNTLETDRGTPRSGLVVLTLGAGLAAATSTSLGVFLVDSAVHFRIAPGSAGLLFAGSALLGLLIRIGLGAAMDRFPGRSPYILAANLLTGGAAGFLLLGSGVIPLFVGGAFLAYGAGWTWPGLLHFAVVRDNRVAAASATGVLQTGLSLGAAGGPLLFGLLVEATSYSIAWFAAAAVALLAAVTLRIGRRMIRQSRGHAKWRPG